MGNADERYRCSCWQGMIQMIVYLAGRGYYFSSVTIFPETKREKWERTDAKIRAKYPPCLLGKDQRYRRHAKGLANVLYLRWEQCAVLMMTEGVRDFLIDDCFVDIRVQPMTVPISPQIELIVHAARGKSANGRNTRSITVHLSRECYRELKASLRDAVIAAKALQDRCARNPQQLILSQFDRLNGLPAWGGIIEQKRQLVDWTCEYARSAGIRIKKDDFRVKTTRKIYQVWATY